MRKSASILQQEDPGALTLLDLLLVHAIKPEMFSFDQIQCQASGCLRITQGQAVCTFTHAPSSSPSNRGQKGSRLRSCLPLNSSQAATPRKDMTAKKTRPNKVALDFMQA
jgi:hypothetical protein